MRVRLRKLRLFYHAIIMPLCVTMIFLASHNASADNPLDKLSDIQETIKNKLREVKETQKKEESVSAHINNINDRIKKNETDLRSYDKGIAETNSKMQNLSMDISRLSDKLETRRKFLKERIRSLYKRQYGDDALILISSRDYQDLIKKSKYISLVAYYDSKVMNKYSSELRKILAKKQDLESLNEQLLENKDKVSRKKQKLQTDRQKKGKLLAAMKNRREAEEKRIKELEASSRKLQNMIKGMGNKKIPKSILGKGFIASKGRLPWPVDGDVLNWDDEQSAAAADQSLASKDGIRIEAEAGHNAKSVAGGRVVYADAFKGYGRLIIIDHGNGYHSLYGNLEDFALAEGDLLVEGMDVGSIRKVKGSGTSFLYFELRHKGKPIESTPWLKKPLIR